MWVLVLEVVYRGYVGDGARAGMHVPHGRQNTNAALQNDIFEHSNDDSSRPGRRKRKFTTLTNQQLFFSQMATLADMIVVPANMLHHRLLGRCSTRQPEKRR